MQCCTEKLIYAPPCQCPAHTIPIQRKLTPLILDCWQRQYNHRPYSTLLLHRKQFECAMHRTMTIEDIETLQQFLHQRHNIDNFELIYMPMPNGKCAENLITTICQQKLINVSLCHLDLSANAISILANAADTCAITTLRLSGNPFNSAEHADALHLFLLKTKTLRYLDIGYCAIDHEKLATIADGLLHCNPLKALDISHIVPLSSDNIIDVPKIATIIAILLSRKRLEEIHLKHCHFDGHDMIPMAEYFGLSHNVVYVNLGSNNIGAHGIETVLKAFTTSNSIIGLDISNNQIGDSGGTAIAHYLPQTKIRYLDIGRNGITSKAMAFILCTIKKSFPIRIFNVVGNHFDNDVGAILERQINAKVLLLHSIDVTTTFDEDMNGFRIVPRYNDKCEYNQRYNRVMPFYRKYDVSGTAMLWWHTPQMDERKLLVNGLFIDPIYVDKCGKVYEIDRNGNILLDKELELYKI